MDIVIVLHHYNKPPVDGPELTQAETSHAQFRDSYLKTIGSGTVENNTLYTSKIHLARRP